MAEFLVVSGGLSVPSSTRLLADRLSDALREVAGADHVIEVHELRDSAHQAVDFVLTGFAHGALEELHARVRTADAIVLVTPIYSQAIAGLMKTFLDTLDPQWLRNKPVLLAATGGTERHQLAIDYSFAPILAYMKARRTVTSVFAASNDWGNPQAVRSLGQRTRDSVGELLNLAGVAPVADTPPPADTPPASVGRQEADSLSSPDFSDLLRAQGIDPGAGNHGG